MRTDFCAGINPGIIDDLEDSLFGCYIKSGYNGCIKQST